MRFLKLNMENHHSVVNRKEKMSHRLNKAICKTTQKRTRWRIQFCHFIFCLQLPPLSAYKKKDWRMDSYNSQFSTVCTGVIICAIIFIIPEPKPAEAVKGSLTGTLVTRKLRWTRPRPRKWQWVVAELASRDNSLMWPQEGGKLQDRCKTQ